MNKLGSGLLWLMVALLGAWAYYVLAGGRGEAVSSAQVLIAAICTYAIGYRFYSRWIAARVLMLNDRRTTPCVAHDDGKDFVKTNRWIVFGHHFAAISGPGPLVGPVLAAQFGYLPSLLWILIGVVLGGAVQDFVTLFFSIRRDGKSLGTMVKEELSGPAGMVALVAILAILTILLAVLGLVVAKALAESPWGVFTVGATIPIAMLMGGYLRYWRAGKVMEATVFGVILLLLAVWGGKLVYANPAWSAVFSLKAEPLAWVIICYGLAASILPVWLLLAPRDYLSTFMKLGTIFALALGILLVLPHLKMPALTQFIDGTGPVLAGKLFPFCFITIACGAVSGFHALVASGTTPKMVTREAYARSIGYGAMCCESLVAIMALIAACTLDPGVYLSINIKGDPAATITQVNSLGFPVTLNEMSDLAATVGENTLFGRTGGAATLAVGMAKIFSTILRGHGLDIWYHFALMFEALFILTTLDAGTRVGRYLLQDVLGHIWKPLGETRHVGGNILASALMVGAWGYFLIQGVRDPLGGINSLWPLFGIANQLLSVVAFCLAVTIILKMHLPGSRGGAQPPRKPRPAYALIALLPLLWLLSVTFTAGAQKIFSNDPKIGFLAQARVMNQRLPGLRETVAQAEAGGDATVIAQAKKAMRDNRTQHFNQTLDAVVAGIFMVLVIVILALSIWEWLKLLSGQRPPQLHEEAPVWLPESAAAGEGRAGALPFLALTVAMARELSGEAAMDRAQAGPVVPTEHVLTVGAPCQCAPRQGAPSRGEAFVEVAERRFGKFSRCC
jgi:carbon starvation protein